MTDIASQLEPCQWRGIKVPISSREYSFAHEQAQHRFVFRDEKLVESLGRDNPGYRYTIPFHETISRGPYENLFVEVYPKFLAACKDRSAGELLDPVHKLVIAKCVSLREVLAADRRSGVDVVVEFIKAPAEERDGREDELKLTGIQGAIGVAGRFDEDVEKIDWEQDLPPETTQDIFTQIQAFGDQVDVIQGNVSGKLENTANKMDRATASIDRLKNPELASTRRSARRIQMSAIQLNRAATTPPRPVSIVKKTIEIGKLAFSGAYGMTIEELHQLNPRLRSVLTVPAGESVTVYRAG